MSLRINVNEISDRMRRGVSDMSYAQRRVFEHRTGIAATAPASRNRSGSWRQRLRSVR